MKKILCAIIGLLFAIPSFANCNLLPVYNTSPETVHGVTFTPQPDGSIIINGSVNDGSEYANYIVARSTNNLVLPAGTYTISGITGGSSSTYTLDLYGGYTSGNATSDFFDTRAGDPITRTATSEWRLGMYAIRIMRGYTANNLVVRPMIERGTTATAYTPYNPQCACEGQSYSGQWNQYVPNGNFSTTNGWISSGGTITAENNTLRFVKNADGQGVVYQSYNDFIVGNKYLITAQVKGPVADGHTFGAGGGAGSSAAFSFSITNSNEYKTISHIVIPNTPRDTTFYFYLLGGSAGAEFDIKNVMAFNLTQMFGAGNEPATAEEAERLIPVIASSLNISATDGYYATNTGQAYSYCATIKVATTKYVETQFGGLSASLAAAVATVNTVVTNTITQAASIATLQSGKQTRPADDTCPAYKQCLLVEDEQGVPHWYQITDPFRDFVAPIIANNVNAASSTYTRGYTQLEYIESTGTQWIDTGIIVQPGVSFETSFIPTQYTDSEAAIIGTDTGGEFEFFYDAAKNLKLWNSANLVVTGGPIVVGTEYNTSGNMTLTSVKIVQNGQPYESTGTMLYNSSVERHLTLFAYAGRLPAYIKMRYMKLSINGTLVRNFVPVMENITGKVGLYDTVGGRFYGNGASSGDDFTPGPIVENDADVPGMTWSATWAANATTGVSAGTVYGEGVCNASTVDATPITDSGWNTAGPRCWCKMVGLESDGAYNNTTDEKWAFADSLGSRCTINCASACLTRLNSTPGFRSALFGM